MVVFPALGRWDTTMEKGNRALLSLPTFHTIKAQPTETTNLPGIKKKPEDKA